MKKILLIAILSSCSLFGLHVDEQIQSADAIERCNGFDYLAMIGSCAGTMGTTLNAALVIYYSQTCNHDNPDCYEFDIWRETPVYLTGLFGITTIGSVAFLSRNCFIKCKEFFCPPQPTMDLESLLFDED